MSDKVRGPLRVEDARGRRARMAARRLPPSAVSAPSGAPVTPVGD
ncbi:MAG: hypothetical protein ABIG44_16435 [Planctomycetota bacterium]